MARSIRAQNRGRVRLLSTFQQFLDLLGIEPDDHVAIDHGDGRRHPSEPLELVERPLVGRDVSLREGDLLLPKELLRSLAEESARLGIDGDALRHCQSFGSFFGAPALKTVLSVIVLAIASGVVFAGSYVISAVPF